MHLTSPDAPAFRPEPVTAVDPATPSRTGRTAAMWLTSLLAAASLAAYEFPHFRAVMEFRQGAPVTLALTYWVLTANTLLLLTPGLLLGSALSRLALPRSAWLTFTAATLAVCLLLVCDVEAQRHAGLPLANLLASVTAAGAGRVGGGAGPIALQILLTITPVILGLLALVALSSRLTPALLHRYPRLAGRWYAPTLATLYAALIAGVTPAQLWFPEPQSLHRLYASMTVPLRGLAAGSLAGDTSSFTLPLARALAPVLRRIGDPIAPRVADTRPLVYNPDPPNLVIICCDSLRADTFTPERMPRLHAWAQKGLWLRRHYAQTNTSHHGVFTILHGRSPAAFNTTLDAKVPPQLNLTLGNAGYRRTYFSPMAFMGWGRMDDYVTPKTFDDIQITTCAFYIGDQLLLTKAARALDRRPGATAEGRPQFVFAFMSSTHHPWVYPDAYETHTPVIDVDTLGWRRDRFADRQAVLNRVLNAARFTDDIVADFLDSLDLSENVVVFTSDHGSGLWDDGTLTHGTRASEFQTRVPCFILGPDIPAKAVDHFTGHTDLVPTLLHAVAGRPTKVQHVDGRDLLDPAQPLLPNQVTQWIGRDHPDHVTLNVFAPDNRLRVRVNRTAPGIEVLGTLDDRGNLDPFNAPPPHQANLWARRIERELWKLRK
jgi:hypothetical protein